mmetsp:Transcript_37564/g.33624  ORF Transcript_37564/g.33624 Transcript_37564/m.33624 type:complete len:83 (+) Transcript_37564:1065-1313(+)
MSNLVNNQAFSDIIFKFKTETKNEIIYAHKVLLLRIPYFSAMFLGEMKESKQTEITIEKISYSTFLELIRYIYTDKVEVKDI